MRRQLELHGAKLGMLLRKGTFSVLGLSPGAARAAPSPAKRGRGDDIGIAPVKYSWS